MVDLEGVMPGTILTDWGNRYVYHIPCGKMSWNTSILQFVHLAKTKPCLSEICFDQVFLN